MCIQENVQIPFKVVCENFFVKLCNQVLLLFLAFLTAVGIKAQLFKP